VITYKESVHEFNFHGLAILEQPSIVNHPCRVVVKHTGPQEVQQDGHQK